MQTRKDSEIILVAGGFQTYIPLHFVIILHILFRHSVHKLHHDGRLSVVIPYLPKFTHVLTSCDRQKFVILIEMEPLYKQESIEKYKCLNQDTQTASQDRLVSAAPSIKIELDLVAKKVM